MKGTLKRDKFYVDQMDGVGAEYSYEQMEGTLKRAVFICTDGRDTEGGRAFH